ncbi:MAG: hypothetical protein KJ077_07700 [Anaerolineae bacterium]|nr:hypothetical protein [Anaerolineae bacterium]
MAEVIHLVQIGDGVFKTQDGKILVEIDKNLYIDVDGQLIVDLPATLDNFTKEGAKDDSQMGENRGNQSNE